MRRILQQPLRRLFVLLLLLWSAGGAFAQSIEEVYRGLRQEAEAAVDPQLRMRLQIMVDLSMSHVSVDAGRPLEIPAHLIAADPEHYLSAAGADGWYEFAGGRLRDFAGDNRSNAVVVTVDGRVYDHTGGWPGWTVFEENNTPVIVQAEEILSATDRAPELLALLMDRLDELAKPGVEELERALDANLELYERKYARGFRSRNILQYYADSALHHFLLKERKRLLSPPSRSELILLAKPHLVVATNSLRDQFSDEKNMFFLVQFLGWDRFVREFRSYWGLSAFAAFPADAEPFDGVYWGLEGHWSNKLLLGVGLRSEDGESEVKVFGTLPFFLGGLLHE